MPFSWPGLSCSQCLEVRILGRDNKKGRSDVKRDGLGNLELEQN